MVSTIERQHPRTPHWYLAVLGTDPIHQGKGIGSALLAPILDRCDREGIGAYLESSKQSNIAFYRRHRFEVTGEIVLPGGPPVWPMWRDPGPLRRVERGLVETTRCSAHASAGITASRKVAGASIIGIVPDVAQPGERGVGPGVAQPAGHGSHGDGVVGTPHDRQ